MPASSRDVIAAQFGAEFDLAFADESTPADRRQLVSDATVLLTMWSGVDAAMMDAAPRCRLIQKLGVGVDRIDTAAAAERGITVLKAAGINADAVAELAVLLTLAVARNFGRAVADARAGRHTKEALRADSIQLVGRTVGLIGLGHIGRAVARRFGAFGAAVAYYDLVRLPVDVETELAVEYRDFTALLGSCDVISLHLPSSPATDGLIDDEAFARMRPGTILINTARGSLVDEAALVRAIESGRLRGAGLDVTRDEPTSPDSPLLHLDRVVVTPHIGGAVADNFPFVIERARRNVTAVLNGGAVSPADTVVWAEARTERAR
jgi:phosphoglycerate dehydrogenase-like enzyme